MTALDPESIIRDLREEWRALGQYRPETTAKLIAATERTASWSLPRHRPTPFPRDTPATEAMPLGGRSTYPRRRPVDRNAAVVPFRASYCAAQAPVPPGSVTYICGEAPGHRGQHRAYGYDDRVITEWSEGAADTPEVGA